MSFGSVIVSSCGIVYVLGTVNFLFDKSQTPYMRADELCTAFWVSQSSGANEGKLIRDMFGISQFDPNWCLPSLVDENLLIWKLKVNGLSVDVRQIQEIAYRKGLIPYIPADR